MSANYWPALCLSLFANVGSNRFLWNFKPSYGRQICDNHSYMYILWDKTNKIEWLILYFFIGWNQKKIHPDFWVVTCQLAFTCIRNWNSTERKIIWKTENKKLPWFDAGCPMPALIDDASDVMKLEGEKLLLGFS